MGLIGIKHGIGDKFYGRDDKPTKGIFGVAPTGPRKKKGIQLGKIKGLRKKKRKK